MANFKHIRSMTGPELLSGSTVLKRYPTYNFGKGFQVVSSPPSNSNLLHLTDVDTTVTKSVNVLTFKNSLTPKYYAQGTISSGSTATLSIGVSASSQSDIIANCYVRSGDLIHFANKILVNAYCNAGNNTFVNSEEKEGNSSTEYSIEASASVGQIDLVLSSSSGSAYNYEIIADISKVNWSDQSTNNWALTNGYLSRSVVNPFDCAVNYDKNQVVYNTTSGDVFWSTDAGDTYTRIETPAVGVAVVGYGPLGFVFDDSINDEVIYLTKDFNTYTSGTLSGVSNTYPNFWIGYAGDKYWVGGLNGKLYSSSDASTWVSRSVNTATGTVYGVAYSPGLNRYVIGTTATVEYSDDGGASWTTGSQPASFYNIIYSPLYQKFYAGSTSGRIYYSTDGDTWTQATVNNLAVGHHFQGSTHGDDGVLFAGTFNGLVKSNSDGTTFNYVTSSVGSVGDFDFEWVQTTAKYILFGDSTQDYVFSSKRFY